MNEQQGTFLHSEFHSYNGKWSTVVKYQAVQSRRLAVMCFTVGWKLNTALRGTDQDQVLPQVKRTTNHSSRVVVIAANGIQVFQALLHSASTKYTIILLYYYTIK